MNPRTSTAARSAAAFDPHAFQQASRMPRLRFDADDQRIRSVARQCAQLCTVEANRCPEPAEQWAQCRSVCAALGVLPPQQSQPAQESEQQAAILRCCDPKWWRRRLRVMVAKRVETAAVRRGAVHEKGQLICTDSALERMRESRKRNSELLEAMQAVNELGECFSLADLASTSTSDNRLRRNELMTRIHGLEELCQQQGHVPLFVTITLPSRFHAVNSRTGRLNPNYDQSLPDAGNKHLCRTWARIRAAFDRLGAKPYGVRVAEPHGDGTPHWHLLVFTPAETLDEVVRIMRDQALAESPNEPGAQQRRFKVERIVPEKGSATGYIAGYVAKNVDGFKVESGKIRNDAGELESVGEPPNTLAERVRCWASLWGIRQFQFFGTPPVLLYRESRRLDEPCAVEAIEEARAPADQGQYAAHVVAVGGLCAKRCELKLRALLDKAQRLNCYGEAMPPRLRGLEAADGSGYAITREHSWTLLPPQRRSVPLDLCR